MASLITNITNVPAFQSGVNGIDIESDLTAALAKIDVIDDSWYQTSSAGNNIYLKNNQGETATVTGYLGAYTYSLSSLSVNLLDNNTFSAKGSLSISQYGNMSGYLSEFKFSSPTISAEVYGKVYPFSTYPTSTLSYLKVTQPNYSVELGGSFDLNLNSGSVNTIKLSYGNQSLSINSTNFDIAKYTNSQFDLNYLYSLALTGNDLITGSSGNEYLNGYAGNDSINSGAGSDSIDGGPGTDQTTFNNPFSNYTITYGTNKVFKVAGPEGTDQVINVEYFTFKDGTLPTDAIRTFDALNYVASYGDLIRAFGTNTDAAESHFISAGYREGRTAHFDTLNYIASYGDLIRAFGTNTDAAESHFINDGYREGRTAHFDTLNYIASYGDLIRAFGTNTEAAETHFITAGYREGRTAHFDTLNYIASYGDLIKAFGTNTDAAEAHFITDGYREGRTAHFDTLNYIASYGDLIRAFGTNTDAAESHFITDGYREGRYAHFDAAQYLSNYSDLQHAFGNDLDAATNHYIRNGFSEGRTDMVIDIQIVGNASHQTHETHF